MLDRSSPVPLYFQLAETLRAAIHAGDYQPGDKLPTENELCETYAVSRSVVRQALQSLAQDNLIETERGRGAFILERKVPISLIQQLDPLHDSMARAGFKLTTKVLRRELITAPPYISEKIGESRAIFMERLRFADGVAFLVVRNYLPLSRTPDLLTYDGLDVVSHYSYLAERYGVIATTGARQVELVRLKDPQTAAHLHLDMGSYVLFNSEITYDQDKKVVEYYESWHHPDRTKLTIELQRRY
jgi:GntR family transcriptional regulator